MFREQYVGSAVNFKTRFRIDKSVIKTKKERCGSPRHFNSKCYHDKDMRISYKTPPETFYEGFSYFHLNFFSNNLT